MEQYINYQNHRIYTRSAGNGETLVFLHGWPTHSLLWEAQLTYFQKKFRTIALDWLGFGKSDKPLEHHYTFTHKKETLDAVLPQLLDDDEQVSLIAHDVGGPPAMLWAMAQPNRIKRLILLNTVFYPFSTPLDKTSHFFFGLPGIRELLVSPFGLRTLLHTLSRAKRQDQSKRIKALINGHKDTNSSIKLKTILEPLQIGKQQELVHLSHHYATLQVEKHLIIAQKDPLCYAHMHKLHQENPDIPVYPIADCGHFIPLDQPEQLNQTLQKILR